MSTMILTEQELRKYLYYSFLKKDMPNVFNSNKNIKNFQHKKSLIKEQDTSSAASNFNPEISKIGSKKVNVNVILSQKNGFAPFFASFINDTTNLDLEGTLATRLLSIVNPAAASSQVQRIATQSLRQVIGTEKVTVASWFNYHKSQFTLGEIKKEHTYKEDIQKLISGAKSAAISPANIDKIRVTIDKGNMSLIIPVTLTINNARDIPSGTEIELGNPASAVTKIRTISPVYDMLQAAYSILNGQYLFNVAGEAPSILQLWDATKFKFTGVLKDRLVSPAASEMTYSEVFTGLGVHNTSVLINKVTEYAEVFQKTYNSLIYDMLLNQGKNSSGVIQNFIESETSQAKNIDFNTGLYEKFLQKKRKKDPEYGFMTWETDTSFFDFFYGKFDSAQGYVDLASLVTAYKAARAASRTNLWWTGATLIATGLSVQNRSRYIAFLDAERDKLAKFAEKYKSGDAIDKETQEAVNAYIKSLADEGIEIDYIDDALEKINEIIAWEAVYTTLDAVGAISVIATLSKVALLKVFDTILSKERKIKFQIPVKPKIDPSTGKPQTRSVNVVDKSGQPVLGPDGKQLTKQEIVFEEVQVNGVRIDPDDPNVQIIESKESGDSFYLIYSCVSPQTDDVFKAMIEDVSDIASEFFAGNYKKLGETIVVEVNGKKVTRTVLEDLAIRYKNWKVTPGNPIYLSSLNIHLAQGDEFLVLFRLLGIADDTTSFKYLNNFSAIGLQELSANLNKIDTALFTRQSFDKIAEGQKFVMNYILKKYPMEIPLSGGTGTLKISSLDDIKNMDTNLFTKNKATINNALKNKFTPDNIKKYASDQLDDALTGVPNRKNYLKDAVDKEGKPIKVLDATAYGNAMREYSGKIKDTRYTMLDSLYDLVLEQHPATLKGFISDEMIRNQLAILKNCDQQLVAGNLDITEESLAIIFRVMKEYNARNELFFQYQRLGKYGDELNDIGSVNKAEVIEDILAKGGQSIDSQLPKQKQKVLVDDPNNQGKKIETEIDASTPQPLPSNQQGVKNITNKKIRDFKDKVEGTFDLPKDNDLVTDVKQYNARTGKNLIDVSELGKRTQVYSEVNVNLAKATSEFREGLEAQRAVVSNLKNHFEQIKGTTGTEVSQVQRDLAGKMCDELTAMEKNLNDSIQKFDQTSYYDSAGAARTKINAQGYKDATGSNVEYMFSKGEGLSSNFIIPINNPFDVKNRQVFMLTSIYSRLKLAQGSFDLQELIFSDIKTKSEKVGIAVQQTSRAAILLGKKVAEDVLDMWKSAKKITGIGVEGIAKQDLVVASNALSKVDKIFQDLVDIEKRLKIQGNPKGARLINGALGLLQIWMAPVKFYISNPTLTEAGLAALDIILVEFELMKCITSSSEFRTASEMKLDEYLGSINPLLPKLTSAVLFNGKKAQVDELNKIVTQGLDVWRGTALKSLMSFKRTLQYNNARYLQEKQRKMLDNINSGLQNSKPISSDPQQKILDKAEADTNSVLCQKLVYDEMLKNINNLNSIPISLNELDDESGITTATTDQYNAFLKKWSTGLDQKTKFLRPTRFPATYFQLNQKATLKDNDIALIEILSFYLTNDVTGKIPAIPTFSENEELKAKAIEDYIKKNGVAAGQTIKKFIKMNIDELDLSDFEESQNMLHNESYKELIQKILKYKGDYGNNTIEETLKNRYSDDEPADKLAAMLENNLFYENSKRTYKLSLSFEAELAKPEMNRSEECKQFILELKRNLKLSSQKAKAISKEIFSTNVSILKNVKDADGKNQKKYVTENYGLLELFKTTSPHFEAIYSNDRSRKIDNFLNSLKNINLKAVFNDNDITSSRYAYISSLKDKVTNKFKYGNFRSKMLFLDFINLFKETGYFEIIKNDANILKAIDHSILYIEQSLQFVIRDTNTGKFVFETRKKQILQKIKTNAEGVIIGQEGAAEQLEQDVNHVVKQVWYNDCLIKIGNILTDVWEPYFKVPQLYQEIVTNKSGYKKLDYIQAGKTLLIKFLKCVRLIKFVSLADEVFKKIKELGSIENDNFLDVISILTGGVNDLNLQDLDLESVPKETKTEKDTVETTSLNNIKKMFSFKNPNKIKQVAGAELKVSKPIKINPDYINTGVDEDYLINSYFDPDTGLSNIVSIHARKMLSTNRVKWEDLKNPIDFVLKASADEIISIDVLSKRILKYVDTTSDAIAWTWSGVVKTTKTAWSYVDQSPVNEGDQSPIVKEGKRNSKKLNNLLLEALVNNKVEMEQSEINPDITDTNLPQSQTQSTSTSEQSSSQNSLKDEQQKINNEKQSRKNREILNNIVNQKKFELKLEDPNFRKEFLTTLFREDLDINYSLSNLLQKESFQKIFENVALIKKYVDQLNLNNDNEIKNNLRQINLIEKDKKILENNLKNLNLKILENDENFKKLMSFTLSDYSLYENPEIDDIKKQTGLNSKFYKAFKKKQNILTSLDSNIDPSNVKKDFDIEKNKRSIILANKYFELITEIFNLSKDNRKINVDQINNQIYKFIENLYQNAEDKDIKAEGEDYLEFLKKFMQREITEINVNSNIIGYEKNPESQNIQKLVLVGDIKNLVENEFLNEFFINLPVIYEIDLQSIYQKKPDFKLFEENFEEKETALKQSDFNYKYYQIIAEDVNSLSSAFVENKILNMNFIGKIFKV